MKFLLLTLFVAAVAASPIPEDKKDVEVVVNGVPEGEPLELGNVVDIKLKEHVNGELASSSDLLHPYTAVGLAQAAAAAAEAAAGAAAPEAPEPIALPEPPIVSPIVLPEPILPVLIPSVEVPDPENPVPVEIPSPVVLPEPVAPVAPVEIPSPVILPEPVIPEAPQVVPVFPPEPQVPVLPEPAAQLPVGEVYNDGLVQVHVNAPEDASVLNTLQSWFNMVVNYFNNGVQYSQQIV